MFICMYMCVYVWLYIYIYVYMKLRIALSGSIKNCVEILMGDGIESVDCFWYDVHFHYANPLSIGVFPSSDSFFIFFLQGLEVFIIQIFYLLG